MKLGSLVCYRESFLGEPILGIILGKEFLGITDYTFYRILLMDGKITVIADTRLTTV